MPSLSRVFPPFISKVLENDYLYAVNIKKVREMSEFPPCPPCGSTDVYTDGSMLICPICGHEWTAEESESSADKTARDSNGAALEDGDAVTVIKDLKVKGSSMVIKRGTKVKSIRLTDNPEEVDCKIEGSSIVLKTCFLRK